jgi:excisionase family DNA binding protein
MGDAARTMEELIREQVAAEVEARVAPLRAELDRLRTANEGWILIPEAAQRLGVTVRTVQRWLRDGRLEAERVGPVRMVKWPPRAHPG